MYSHGGLEMNSLFRLDHPMMGGAAAAEDSKTSFENETESLYLTQLDSQHEIAPAMSSAWNSDLCGSLVHQQPRAMIMVRPEDVTGQKPVIPKAEPNDQDEAEVMEMIEANFDLSTLMDTTPIAESTVIEETQETIDDMAQFLQTYDPRVKKEEPVVEEQSAQALPSCLADELLSLEQRQTLDQMDLPTQLSEEDLKDAETLLDTLLGSNTSPEESTPALQRQQHPTADILKAAVDSEGLSDSGFQSMLEEAQSSSGQYTVANVSHCVTSDGKQVIIVVQRPTEASTSAARKLLPRPSSSDDDEDGDPAWQPEHPQKRRPGRKRENRVSLAAPPHGVSKKSYRNIKDRKERKKIQNVEAARRYRDKKKQEQVEMEAEEAVERARNMKLRGQLKDIQSEVNTMMKLMKELGMLKSK